MRIFFLLVVTLLMLGCKQANGCPNSCAISIDSMNVEPALPCARIDFVADSCDCGIVLTANNDCSTSFETLNFMFNSCKSQSADLVKVDCKILSPGESAVFRIDYNLDMYEGQRTHSFRIKNGDSIHTAEVTRTVASIENSDENTIGCQQSGKAIFSGMTGVIVIIGFLGITALRKRPF